jgi:hypothetical protein
MEFRAEFNSDLTSKDATLLTNMGYALKCGTLFHQDYEKAAKCYYRAAALKEPQAMNKHFRFGRHI